MTFWQKIKQTLRSFMDGRHGADQLSMALLWAGLIAYLLGTIFSGVQGFILWPLFGHSAHAGGNRRLCAVHLSHVFAQQR